MDEFTPKHQLRHQFDVLRASLMLMLAVIALNLAARLWIG
jgi:hypothetical protein